MSLNPARDDVYSIQFDVMLSLISSMSVVSLGIRVSLIPHYNRYINEIGARHLLEARN